MPKKSYRPSNSYPPEFLQLSLHVLGAEKPLEIKTLGDRPQSYTSFASRYNEWRLAVARERGRADPLVQQLYTLTIKLNFDRKTKSLKPGESHYGAYLAKSDEELSEGLRQIAQALPKPPEPPSTLTAEKTIFEVMGRIIEESADE